MSWREFSQALGFNATAACVGATVALAFAQSGVLRPIAAPPPATEATALPPARFTGGGQATVRFVPPYMISDYCGDNAIACADAVSGTTITIINPCVLSYQHPLLQYRQRRGRPPAEQYDIPNEFSTTLCHELGHINGWSHVEDGTVSNATYPGQPQQRQ